MDAPAVDIVGVPVTQAGHTNQVEQAHAAKLKAAHDLERATQVIERCHAQLRAAAVGGELALGSRDRTAPMGLGAAAGRPGRVGGEGQAGWGPYGEGLSVGKRSWR